MIVRTVNRISPRARPLTEGGFGTFRVADAPARTHPELDEWLCRRILAGMHPKAVAAASDGRMHVRTAYRWRRALVGLETIELGGHRATFAIRRDGPPSRITTWERIK